MDETSHKSPIQLDVGGVRKALADPSTSGLVLITICLSAFGPAVFGDEDLGIESMDPAEMWAGLYEIYDTWMTEEGENRVNALITVSEGLYHADPEAFHAVTIALADGEIGDVIEGEFDPPGAAEVMWSVMETSMFLEAADYDVEFSPKVERAMERILQREPEDLSEISQAINEDYLELLMGLREIGVPLSALRLYDEAWVNSTELLEAAGNFEFDEKNEVGVS